MEQENTEKDMDNQKSSGCCTPKDNSTTDLVVEKFVEDGCSPKSAGSYSPQIPVQSPEEYMQHIRNISKELQKQREVHIKSSSPPSQTAKDRWFIHSTNGEILFGSVIVVNAVYMGVETDYKRENFDLMWFSMECAFLFIFSVELIMRIVAERSGFVKIRWNWFDAFLVMISFLDVCVLTPVSLAGDNANSDLAVVNLFRAARLARLARILRILRILRYLRELLILIRGIYGALKALGWATGLLVLVLYVTAIFTTKLMGKNPHVQGDDGEAAMYFGTMLKSMFTLFQIVTLEGWNEVARHMMADDAVGFSVSIFFVLFLMFTNLALLNLITGVIFDNVLRLSKQVEIDHMEAMEKERLESILRLEKVFEEADFDNNGIITLDEFRDNVRSNEAMQAELKRFGIGVYDAESLFVLLDYDCKGSLKAEEFVDGCLKARGPATAKQVLGLQTNANTMWSNAHSLGVCSHMKISSFEERLQNIEETLERLLKESVADDDLLNRVEDRLIKLLQDGTSSKVV